MNEPPVTPPPIVAPPPGGGHTGHKPPPKGLWGILVTVGALLAKFGKALLLVLKFGKVGSLLTTTGTMFVSAWAYSMVFGWSFAVGFVLTILIHELGHVAAAALFGVPVSAPVFIPFMGAMIINKRSAKSAWAQAVIGIGGPVFGTLAGVVCFALFFGTGSRYFLALAYVTFFLNLFNMTPVLPLDGGWVTAALSPYLLLIGMVVLGVMFLTGQLHNPMVLILVIMAVPRTWHAIRTKSGTVSGAPCLPHQKVIMGASYLALVGFLALAMGFSHTVLTEVPAHRSHEVFNARTTSPGSAWRPSAFLEKTVSPSTETSKTPPLEGTRVMPSTG